MRLKSLNMSTNEPSGPKQKRGDESAKEWAHNLAENFGQAVRFWRAKMELTAVELSNRTKEVGYPITRATIAKIESNSRNSKVDVAEVLTLAAALRVAPIDLIFPGFPARKVRATQRVSMPSREAQQWFNADTTYQRSPISQVGGPHMPTVENSEQLRREVGDFERYSESIWEEIIQTTGVPFPDPPILLEGADYYWQRIKLLMRSIERANGHVLEPAWLSDLKEPDNGEG